MDCKTIELNIVDYCDGLLSKEAAQNFESHIKSCDHCQVILKETEALLSAFERAEDNSPSEQLRTDFYKLLEEERRLDHQNAVSLSHKQTEFPWKYAFQIAASIVLMLGGYLFGTYNSEQSANQKIAALEQETTTLRQDMMLAMIENQSPSKRIQAVNFTENFVKPDDKILKALINRMQFDGNINVRLAAAEALSEFPESNLVKDAFIEALTTQKDPSLQIAIIQFLVKIQEKRAIAPMQQLLEQEDIPNYVREQVNSGISQII